MKKYLLWTLFSCMIGACFLFSSCKPKDSDIQAAIEAKKKEVPELANMMASVNDGVVTLTGECKDEADKALGEKTISALKGVKQVINNCTVTPPAPPPVAPAPVVITADDPLSKAVTDAVKDYPGVHADVKEGVVTLTGEIKRDGLKKLMMALHTLKPKKIDNQLTIK